MWDLVAGDIIILETGDKVPADCLVIESNNLQLSRSTNEIDSKDYKSRKSDPFLKVNCLVSSGECKALVCCVGSNSTRKRDPTGIHEQMNEDTPLMAKLKSLEN